ncbi:MAG: metallopeptidase TldD-related protein [Bacteroidales bacterium]
MAKFKSHSFIKFLALLLVAPLFSTTLQGQDPLLDIIEKELYRYKEELSKESLAPYFLSCRVEDVTSTTISATLGYLTNSSNSRIVALLPEVRVGTPQFDNFHNNATGAPLPLFSAPEPILLPYDSKTGESAIKQILWNEVMSRYRYAVANYNRLTSSAVAGSKESDKSPDFTPVKAENYYRPPLQISDVIMDIPKEEGRAKKLSATFEKYPQILEGNLLIRQKIVRKSFVSTEGSKIAHNIVHNSLMVRGMVKADDGMELPLISSYFSFDKDSLPSDQFIEEEIEQMAERLIKLKNAPVVQPYTAPALLSGSAAGVFFHEIFGHRIEGQKMKSDSDGQTFKKMVGREVLPTTLSVYDDPTLTFYNNTDLSGHYKFDDQGVAAERVVVVEDGVLKNFLMTRTAIEGFPRSNGHARAEIGYDPTSRQSNLIVESSDHKSEEELRQLLIAEIEREGKEYGFFFREVTGGFTITGRSTPNAFNVTPLEVYRVYPDGREDELVRGVDLIGTPLSMFSNIIYAGGKSETFIGNCGSLSGFVPVTATAPAILVNKVELQMKPRARSLPPILKRPL